MAFKVLTDVDGAGRQTVVPLDTFTRGSFLGLQRAINEVRRANPVQGGPGFLLEVDGQLDTEDFRVYGSTLDRLSGAHLSIVALSVGPISSLRQLAERARAAASALMETLGRPADFSNGHRAAARARRGLALALGALGVAGLTVAVTR